MALDPQTLKKNIIQAGMRAVEQLIKVAKEDIIKPDPEDELAADRLKNAAATKKLAGPSKLDTKQGFAERRSS
jgi:hypothetical protein